MTFYLLVSRAISVKTGSIKLLFVKKYLYSDLGIKMIRQVNKNDAEQLTIIYNYYVKNTIITFEEIEIDKQEMTKRIAENLLENLPWIVFEEDSNLLGLAYASQWKSRCSYRHSVEVTVYLDKDCKGKGIGSQLYEKLIQQIKESKYHALLGGISLPNEASIKLHEKFGFKKVAHFKEVGYKFNKFIDVGYWELIL